MGTFICNLLFSLLAALVYGQQEYTRSSLDESVRVSVTRAVQWMKDQRRADHSWGDFTPRAVMALSLSQEVVPLSKDEVTIMRKQLNVLLSLELARNLTMKNLGLSRLALYVNALYATCQDPRNFHGLDLVQILRTRTDLALSNISDFSLPVVFIPLCLAKVARFEDVYKIIHIYNNYKNKTDLQAVALLGLCCIAEQNHSSTIKQYVDSYVGDFASHFRSAAPSTDVQSLALALQVLQPADVTSLMRKQHPDGSFGSILGTYYALPALLGKNILSIRNTHCSKDSPGDDSMSYPLSEHNSPKVYYSVWLGEGDDQDSRTVTVSLPFNCTFFDVMQMAQGKNSNFRFSYEEKNRGKHVYQLGGVPNDAQRELRWILYKTKGVFHHKKSLQEIDKGVDQIHPAPEDHFIFWFRRHPLGV